MAEPFVGEIRQFAGGKIPAGWELCNGQAVSIAQYGDLYSVIHTIYGGDGVSTFNLPDLQSRVPLHPGQGAGSTRYSLGQTGGSETVALTTSQTPAHSHAGGVPVNNAMGGVATPADTYLGNSNNPQFASEPTEGSFLPVVLTGTTGRGNAHANVQPYLCLNFLIATQGIVPKPRS